jgi:DNA-binding IclR family transcriptional regulator
VQIKSMVSEIMIRTKSAHNFIMQTLQTTAAEHGKEDRHFVTALARGLEVLSCFRTGDKSLGNQEIAKRCKLPKSTVSRLTYTLTKLGYLIQLEESGKYRLGTATLALGSYMMARLDVKQMARPMMQALAEFAKATVSLGTRDRLAMLYVENCRSSAALTLSVDVGSRIPLLSSALGRAYLAEISPAERGGVAGALSRVRRAGLAEHPVLDQHRAGRLPRPGLHPLLR